MMIITPFARRLGYVEKPDICVIGVIGRTVQKSHNASENQLTMLGCGGNVVNIATHGGDAMTEVKREAVLKALAGNDWTRLREIAGRGCIISLIREAQA